MDAESSHVPQSYQVNVVILEGRHLALTNANTKVIITIGKKKKKVHAKANNTDSPYYNDFCVFNFYLPLNVLLNEILIIKVYQFSKLIRKLVGSFNVELATVWSQPNHQFYHKWAVLTDPKNPTAGVRGFLKCDIAILAKGIVVKPSSEQDIEENLEESLLVPYGGIKDRHRTRIVFSIFRADGISIMDHLDLKIYQPYVKITYGGDVRKTSIAKNKEAPVWNEEVTFCDLFPPLYQNILVEICDRQKPVQKSSLGNTNIDIRCLYEDGENGFLPTFGPNFLYLYAPFDKFERHQNCCSVQNSFTYMCRLLLAIRTEMVDYAEDVKVQKKKQTTVPKLIPPLIENVYCEYKKFILFAAIFDVLFFDAKFIEKNIRIRVTFGPKKSTDDKGPEEKDAVREADGKTLRHLNVKTGCDTTPTQKCTLKADYSFIAFSGKFPCVHVFGEWPDSLRRMYRSNVIKKAIQNCVEEVNKVKGELEYQSDTHHESSKRLKDILENLSKSCEVILLLTGTKLEDTNLYRERKRFYHREIAEIAKNTKIASIANPLTAEDTLQKISTYLATLTKYAQDPENSFPDTEIWMRRNNQITAQYRIRTEDVAYSSDFNERGMMSGKIQTIIIQGDKENKTKAKIDIFAWFGLADDFMECLKMLPAGFKHDHRSCPSSIELKIPSQIIYEEAHHFQCRVHIYQAKIMVGFDNTGLSDAFIRAIISGQHQVTGVQKATLNPVWDETLVFSYITLYGPVNYIKENSTRIIIEVFDKDKLRKAELIGMSLVEPVVKLKDEKYEPPLFPPKLRWEAIRSKSNEVGKVLMVAELIELSESLHNLYSFSAPQRSSLSIPPNIRPRNIKYRLEVLFWGVRELKRKRSLKNKVFVTLECGDKVIKSPVIKNVRHKLNFESSVECIEVELPEEPEYAPPLCLKLFHIASITFVKTYVATCIVPSVRSFFCSANSPTQQTPMETTAETPKKQKTRRKTKMSQDVGVDTSFAIVKSFRYWKCKMFKKCEGSAYEMKPIREEDKADWWTKYHASIEGPEEYPGIPTFKIYNEELESQRQFNGLSDFLYTFNMTTGHGKRAKGGVIMAKVKAALKLYKWSPEDIEVMKAHHIDTDKGILSKAPSNDAVKFVVRVYVICGKNLAPRDIYGKSDPYLLVQLGDHTINDRDHYAPKQLNPTFGKCFEIKGTLPQDHLLRVKVLDYDASSKDDLIGETSIDIENRYYSKHHATCGLPQQFESEGFNAWRDIYLPSDILRNLCLRSNLPPPAYEKNSVMVNHHEFPTVVHEESKYRKEIQALSVLNRWQELPIHGFELVPEHVETRSLYHPSLPGIEQGKLEMWVDVFPADYRYMSPKVDISPRPAVPMELRAIVWNVDDVVLDDKSFFFNEKMSDIYVRGWILSLEEEMQKTDVHYRSLNGEGNFNWRFIFHFNYIPSERKMAIKRKIDAFDMHPEERKHHCKLEIQIWDNDAFGDDYLGTLILELCSMPRGAKLSNRCTLKMLSPNATKINLFKIRKTRGWWPFRRAKVRQTIGNEFELTGKIDLELEILTEAEAKVSPAGKGREEPNALPPPVRPATSFNWMLNPLKTFRYIIWKKIGKYVILALIIMLLAFFLLTALYAFPNYLVKKFLRA